jgi:hypothetical protein
MAGDGAFTVEYGGQPASSGFYPFTPQVLQPRRGLAPAQEHAAGGEDAP